MPSQTLCCTCAAPSLRLTETRGQRELQRLAYLGGSLAGVHAGQLGGRRTSTHKLRKRLLAPLVESVATLTLDMPVGPCTASSSLLGTTPPLSTCIPPRRSQRALQHRCALSRACEADGERKSRDLSRARLFLKTHAPCARFEILCPSSELLDLATAHRVASRSLCVP